MAVLEVNGVEYEVVGGVDYSTKTTQRTMLPGAGGHYAEKPAAPYITAMIRIGPTQSSSFDPPSEVRLELDSGQSVYGADMFETGDGTVRGNLRTVLFYGNGVEVV